MMLAWWLYATVVAALFGLAALAAERAARVWHRPARWAWAGALAGSIVVPAVAWLAPPDVGSSLAVLPDAVAFMAPPLVIGPGSEPLLALPVGVLAATWLAASLALCTFAGWSLVRVVRLRGRWRQAVVDGEPVLVSADVGPAAVGVVRGDVVLPAWVLGLERRLRRLVLLHEREHLRAGDPRLILLGFAAVAVAPWNPLLWWQFRRLRLAVEVDCDGRVLRGSPDVGAYGAVLLEVGRRRSAARFAMAAFVEPHSFLERRIRIMTRMDGKHRLLVGVGFAALAGVMLAVACQAPEPAEGERDAEALTSPDAAPQGTAQEGDVSAQPTFTPYTVAPELKNRDDASAALDQNYPPLLRDAGIGGQVLVWFLIDKTGEVQNATLKETSGHEALDQAALSVARAFRFSPALNRDQPVPVWIALPIVFQPEAQ